MKKITVFAIVAIILATIAAADSLYNPLWKVTINSDLSGYGDDFSIGVGSPAIDAYDINDIVKAPQAPGRSIIIQSVVDGRALAGDYRAEGSILRLKKWEISLIAIDPNFVGFSGIENLTWNLERVPRNTKLTLIDYGADSTRSNIIKTVNMKKSSLYSFNVTNKFGVYRYIDIKVTKSLI